MPTSPSTPAGSFAEFLRWYSRIEVMPGNRVNVPMVRPAHLDHSRSDLVMFAVVSALSEKLKLADIQSVTDFRWREFCQCGLTVFVAKEPQASNTSCKIASTDGRVFYMGTNPSFEPLEKELFKFFPSQLDREFSTSFRFNSTPEWMTLANTSRAARAAALFRICIDTANTKTYTDTSTSIIRKISLDLGNNEPWAGERVEATVQNRKRFKDCVLATVRYTCGTAWLTAEIVEEKSGVQLGEA